MSNRIVRLDSPSDHLYKDVEVSEEELKRLLEIERRFGHLCGIYVNDEDSEDAKFVSEVYKRPRVCSGITLITYYQ